MLPDDKYTGIASAAQGLYKESGSRFLAYAYPVRSEEEVKPLVDALRREHHGARHHCYAYRISCLEDGPSGPVLSKEGLWRANDDGEPSGTAGRQILSQIDSRGLKDVLVVVVRYFGGILLGVPGLIRAYRSAAADALDAALTVECTASRNWKAAFPYDAMPGFMAAVKNFGAEVLDRSFGDECEFLLRVPAGKEHVFFEHIEKIGIFKNKIQKQ